jgi:hypothetical protein
VLVSLDIVIAGLIVGFLVGMTGAGGGALMTPILILLFGVAPSAAVSSDVVASAIMMPFGGTIHFRRGTVHMSLVRWLSLGSVPAAFAGVFIDHALGSGKTMQQNIEYVMGVAIILAAIAMIVRLLLDSAGVRKTVQDDDADIPVKRLLTVVIGIGGGLLVGMTSVGAGSLMMVLLMIIYPAMSMRRLVGTGIVQSMPLVGAAAIGHALFGSTNFGISGSILAGSIPGVLIGSWLAARASNVLLRPLLAFVLVASALKLFGIAPVTLGVTMALVALVGLPAWAFIDARSHPAAGWSESGYQRGKLLTLLSVGAPVGVGLVTGVLYFSRIRPRIQLSSAAGEAPSAGVSVPAARVLVPAPSGTRSSVG